MHTTLLSPVRMGGIAAAVTLTLLTALNRPARAEKSVDCLNHTSVLCEQVEKCNGGFEANGTCKWTYTITRYYWKY